MHQAMGTINDISRFAKFARHRNFWVFADDQATSDSQKVSHVNIFFDGQIVTIKSDSSDEKDFGKHTWISSDNNEGSREGAIIAISSTLSNEPFSAKVNFYRAIPHEPTSSTE